MTNFWRCFRLFLWLTVLTGVLYPLLITFIAYFTMHPQSTGSIIIHKDKAIGSKLIAQKFSSDKYFWPRPSAVDYNPLPSGGSNLGPISLDLKKAVDMRTAVIKKAHPDASIEKIPAELLFASGSGLDPHISPETAFFQIDRIAKASKMDEEALKQLVNKMTDRRQLGFLGTKCVNVLMLNIALDELHDKS